MKVLNFGSLNIDYVYSVDHMVKEGETLASKTLQVFCGGKGLNQSIALSRAGVKVYQAGCIGEDGELLVKTCKANGIDISYLKEVPGKNGHAIIQLDQGGNNCILLYGGSNQCITKDYVDEILQHFEKGDFIVLQNEISQISYIIEKAYKKGMQIVLNPSPYNEQILKEDLKKVSFLIFNEIEGEQITGEADIEKMTAYLEMHYPHTQLIVTLGEKGSYYSFQGTQIRQEIYPAEVVDTTAAGDTFTGYFLASVIKHQSISKALQIAAKAAALTVTKKGAAASIPFKEEVKL